MNNIFRVTYPTLVNTNIFYTPVEMSESVDEVYSCALHLSVEQLEDSDDIVGRESVKRASCWLSAEVRMGGYCSIRVHLIIVNIKDPQTQLLDPYMQRSIRLIKLIRLG